MGCPGRMPPITHATRELDRPSSTSMAHLPLAMPRSPPAPEKSPDGIAPRGLRPSRTRESSQIPGSSERVDGLSRAYATDYSRYARAGSAVFDLHGAPPSRHASLASGDPKVAGRNRTAGTDGISQSWHRLGVYAGELDRHSGFMSNRAMWT